MPAKAPPIQWVTHVHVPRHDQDPPVHRSLVSHTCATHVHVCRCRCWSRFGSRCRRGTPPSSTRSCGTPCWTATPSCCTSRSAAGCGGGQGKGTPTRMFEGKGWRGKDTTLAVDPPGGYPWIEVWSAFNGAGGRPCWLRPLQVLLPPPSSPPTHWLKSKMLGLAISGLHAFFRPFFSAQFFPPNFFRPPTILCRHHPLSIAVTADRRSATCWRAATGGRRSTSCRRRTTSR
jgi:hypothetical protein